MNKFRVLKKGEQEFYVVSVEGNVVVSKRYYSYQGGINAINANKFGFEKRLQQLKNLVKKDVFCEFFPNYKKLG